MDKLIWIALAFLSGTFLPIQGGLNARLGKAIESPVQASMVSFIVGAAALVLYVIVSGQSISWAGVKTAPPYVWLGGLLGAFYVTVIVMAFPRLGPGLTFGLVIAGQMIVSVLLEHFNVLVAQPQPVSYMRVVGIAMVVGGVFIIRKF
ncbi:MAG: DMT family transporter [Chitinophagales bacterium]|nr:DMT family transporter [Chitinophagales bacterium]